MTFRALLAMLSKFAEDNPGHEALDEDVVVRVRTSEDNGDDLHVGGLRVVTVDAGCTDTFALVLDADQDPDEELALADHSLSGAVVSGMDPCACGHSPEEHGRDPDHPSSTHCTECDCIAYEADPPEEE